MQKLSATVKMYNRDDVMTITMFSDNIYLFWLYTCKHRPATQFIQTNKWTVRQRQING